MASSTHRSLRPYIASSHQLNFHSEDNAGASAENVCAKLCLFLSENGFVRASVKRNKAKRGKGEKEADISKKVEEKNVRCNGVHLGMRSLLRLLNKRFVGPKSGQEAQQQKLVLVLLDANFVKPTALRHVFALLALGSNAPPFFLLPNLSSSLCVPLNLPRLSAVTFTSNAPPGLVLLAAQIRDLLRPIELTRRSVNNTSLIKAPEKFFETPKLIRPAGKPKRKARRKK